MQIKLSKDFSCNCTPLEVKAPYSRKNSFLVFHHRHCHKRLFA